MEKYFEDLLRDWGLDDAERDNWYKARHFVQNVMPPLEGEGIAPRASGNVHVVIEDADNPLMQAVARQICLMAHYPNFNEDTGENRTLITLCSENSLGTYERMRKEKVLGNLLDFCCCYIAPDIKTTDRIPLDIELEFLDSNPYSEDEAKFITLADVDNGTVGLDTANAKIDVTMGMLVNMVYNTGAEIDNLPATDNANIGRYSTALNVFCYKLKKDMICNKWCECGDVRNKLSSVFCADCFEARIRGLLDTKKKTLSEYILHDLGKVMKEICKEENINALARCEHSRWNVEKLIMGFSPLQECDWFELENCFGKERNDKIKTLKKKYCKHIDLCSYRNLKRVNPVDIKYDYFLMLAMPQIMRSDLQS